jgi:hypothetical protein
MSDLAPNGNVTRFTQFGTFSVVTCCAIGCLSAAIAWATPQAIVELGFGSAICFGVAILLSQLTIEVSDAGVRWYFTGGLFGNGLDFDEIAAVTIQEVTPLGFGYRVGYKKAAWLVSGRNVVVFSRGGSDLQYLVGTSEPEAVRDEIERRRHPETN